MRRLITILFLLITISGFGQYEKILNGKNVNPYNLILKNKFIWEGKEVVRDSLVYAEIQTGAIRFRYFDGSWTDYYQLNEDLSGIRDTLVWMADSITSYDLRLQVLEGFNETDPEFYLWLNNVSFQDSILTYQTDNQTLSTNGNPGVIAIENGNSIIVNVDDADASSTNEIQDISTTGAAGNISISDGSTLNLNVNDADASISNEIQSINLDANILSISNDISTVDLSGYLDNTDNQQLSIDSTNRVFTIALENGGNVKFEDRNFTGEYDDLLNRPILMDNSNEADPLFKDWNKTEGINIWSKQIFDWDEKLEPFALETDISGGVLDADFTSISVNGESVVVNSDLSNYVEWNDTTSYIETKYNTSQTYEPILTKGNLTENITGLEFDNTRQVIGGAAQLSLSTGYAIPSTTDIFNWNTAYGWGNHALAGYLTSVNWGDIGGTLSNQTDLQTALNGKEDAFSKNTGFNLNLGTTAGTVAEGNDSRIINGQTAYSWGDHALAGYLTSFTETDPIVGAINGLVKADGLGNISAATDGTDYNSQNLQEVTNKGNQTTNPVIISNYLQSGIEVTVAEKNKHYQLLRNPAGTPYAYHQFQYWNGTEFVVTQGYGFGHYALYNNTGAYSNGFGHYALYNNTGAYSNGFGHYALRNNTGANSNGFGLYALHNNTGAYSNGFGYLALYNNTGAYSNGFGYLALQNNTGAYSNGFGYHALRYVAETSSNLTAIGHNAAPGTVEAPLNFQNATAIGANSIINASNSVNLGSVAVNKLFIANNEIFYHPLRLGYAGNLGDIFISQGNSTTPAWTTKSAINVGDFADDGTYEPAFSKNTAFNKNFGTTSGTVAEGNDSRILNGQTAYGWGDHSLVGYLTQVDTTASNIVDANWKTYISNHSGSSSLWTDGTFGYKADTKNLEIYNASPRLCFNDSQTSQNYYWDLLNDGLTLNTYDDDLGTYALSTPLKIRQTGLEISGVYDKNGTKGTNGQVLSSSYGSLLWIDPPSGSGTGTVTSVGVSSSDFIVSGSPITTNGTITLNLDNDAIANQTALTSGLVSTDELLVSDAGLLKRMDVSVLQTYMQNNLSFGGGAGLWTDAGNYTYLASTADNVVIGSSSSIYGYKFEVQGYGYFSTGLTSDGFVFADAFSITEEQSTITGTTGTTGGVFRIGTDNKPYFVSDYNDGNQVYNLLQTATYSTQGRAAFDETDFYIYNGLVQDKMEWRTNGSFTASGTIQTISLIGVGSFEYYGKLSIMVVDTNSDNFSSYTAYASADMDSGTFKRTRITVEDDDTPVINISYSWVDNGTNGSLNINISGLVDGHTYEYSYKSETIRFENK